MELTPKRQEKFERVVDQRQGNLTVILENVHDAHNIGAVLRTCDSVGIGEIYILYTDEGLSVQNIKLGKNTSAGARKWVNVYHYTNPDKCFRDVKAKYSKIYATHLDNEAVDLYELDLTESVALLFGNEHKGVSEKALEYTDGNFVIPQIGMVESLNISVACAVSLYEAFRQRATKGFIEQNMSTTKDQKKALLQEYLTRNKKKPSSIKIENRD